MAAKSHSLQAFELHRPIGELTKYGLGGVCFGPPPMVGGWSATMNEAETVLTLRVRQGGRLVWGPRRIPVIGNVFHYQLSSATVRDESDE